MENKNPINIDNANRISRINRIVGAGTPGKMIQAAASPYISNAARKTARARRLKKIKERRAAGKRGKESAPEKKMTGAGFYMIVGVAVTKDLVDLIDLTGVGAILTSILGFIISYIVFFYLFYIGVKLNTRKLATFAISVIIELIPGLNLLPTFSFSLFIIRALENNPKLKKLASVAKGKAK